MSGLTASCADPSGVTGPLPRDARQDAPEATWGMCSGRRSAAGTDPVQPLAHSS
jgi:hypothetical protein